MEKIIWMNKDIEALEQAEHEAWSIQSKPEEIKAELIGKVRKGTRIIAYYKDTSGNYWYETRFLEGNEEISEYEAIFGRKEKRWKRRK